MRETLVRELEAYQTTMLEQTTRSWATLWSDALALRRLIMQHMPATLYYAERANATVYWYQFGQRTARWQVQAQPLPAWIEAQLEDAANVMSGSGPSGADLTTVYIVHYREEPFFVPFSAIIHDFLTHRPNTKSSNGSTSRSPSGPTLGGGIGR